MKIFGLTGGIATGKSTVRRIFDDLGVVTVDADEIAKQIVEPQQPAYNEIVKTFGREVLQDIRGNPHPPLDRAKLGAIVFSDAEKRKKINKITHGRVIKEMFKQVVIHFLKGTPVILLDVPLLIESKLQRWCSQVIVVYVPSDLQLSRLLSRNPELGDEAKQRIASQMDIEEKKKIATILIDNTGSLEQTQLQVQDIYRTKFPKRSLFSVRNILFAVISFVVIGTIWTLK